jgi:hypothetical protein
LAGTFVSCVEALTPAAPGVISTEVPPGVGVAVGEATVGVGVGVGATVEPGVGVGVGVGVAATVVGVGLAVGVAVPLWTCQSAGALGGSHPTSDVWP